jgi:hypothetical protein
MLYNLIYIYTINKSQKERDHLEDPLVGG